jgi:hypothetical protein
MKNVNSLIGERFKKGSSSTKMTAMAERSATGNLTSFAGLFSMTDLSPSEKEALENLLTEYAVEGEDIQNDLKQLIAITSEVKAINNQAAILHGERIKKVHTILTGYKDGAFTSWLMATYGNRQTPYNLMQYYEFYEALPQPLRPKLEEMPRQAIYTLASREGNFDKKLSIVEMYAGENKNTLLAIIRESFPLEDSDRRKQNFAESAILNLRKVYITLERARRLNTAQKDELKVLIQDLKKLIDIKG